MSCGSGGRGAGRDLLTNGGVPVKGRKKGKTPSSTPCLKCGQAGAVQISCSGCSAYICSQCHWCQVGAFGWQRQVHIWLDLPVTSSCCLHDRSRCILPATRAFGALRQCLTQQRHAQQCRRTCTPH
jgi:hypothetical protein